MAKFLQRLLNAAPLISCKPAVMIQRLRRDRLLKPCKHGSHGLGRQGFRGLGFRVRTIGCTLNRATFRAPNLLQRDWFLRLLYEFLETRIAAQMIPERVQTQLAVRNMTGNQYNLL